MNHPGDNHGHLLLVLFRLIPNFLPAKDSVVKVLLADQLMLNSSPVE
jgi:hypothetical protein